MLYLDLVIYLHSLPVETKIIILQLTLIIAEIIAFFYIRHITKTD
jgi:hypothetical protein